MKKRIRDNSTLIRALLAIAAILVFSPVSLADKLEKKKKKADELYNLCKYKEAEKLYHSITKVRDNDKFWSMNRHAPYALYREGMCLDYQGKHKKAIKRWDDLVDIYKNSPYADDALKVAAATYIGPLGKWKKGLEYYKTILSKYRKGDMADEACYFSGVLYYWHDKPKDAIKSFKKLLRDYPDTPYKEAATELIAECEKKRKSKK